MIFLSPERMFQRNVFLLHEKLIEPLLRVKEKKKIRKEKEKEGRGRKESPRHLNV